MRLMLLGPANSIHLQRWAGGLQARGHEVCVVSQHPCDEALLPAGVERLWLPWRGGAGYLLNAAAVRRAVRRWRPQLVNVHYASGYGTLGRLARVSPSLLSVWGSDVYEFPAQGRLQALWLRSVLRHADAVASTSHAMAGRVRQLTPERREIAVTPFGVDLDRFTPQPRPEGAPLTIGTVKLLAPTYGIDLLLQAFAGLAADPQVPAECQLLLVGDGPQRMALQALADRLGIAARTRFVGAVPHADVPGWLGRIDVFVAPSRAESFGVAVLEASACGRPVVVSDAGGLPEVVLAGETGRIVPVGDVAALAAAIKPLLLDAGLRATLGRQGRQFVEREYAWPACLARMEQAYAGLLARRGAA